MTHCILCNGELSLTVPEVKDWEYGCQGIFNFYGCPGCGIIALNPQPNVEELKSYYPPEYHGYHTLSRGFTGFIYNILYLNRIKEYVNLAGFKGKILDVGCADAAYFGLLKSRCRDIELVGVEFKDDIAQLARSKGFNVLTGTIFDVNYSEYFDLIVMNNLIEHTLEPSNELKKACSLLKKGGTVVLETPNINSWDFFLMGRFWGGLHVPRHTYLFSISSLSKLAGKAGLNVNCVEYLLNTDHWALSIQNLLQDNRYLRCRLKKGRAWYYKYLLILFIPLNLIQLCLRKTGSMKVLLKKCS